MLKTLLYYVIILVGFVLGVESKNITFCSRCQNMKCCGIEKALSCEFNCITSLCNTDSDCNGDGCCSDGTCSIKCSTALTGVIIGLIGAGFIVLACVVTASIRYCNRHQSQNPDTMIYEDERPIITDPYVLPNSSSHRSTPVPDFDGSSELNQGYQEQQQLSGTFVYPMASNSGIPPPAYEP